MADSCKTLPIVPVRPVADELFAVLSVIFWLGSFQSVLGQGESAPLPYRPAPIDYFGTPDDAVARLVRRIDSGETSLTPAATGSYLGSLLNALDIPADSQLLVFSKNAASARLISPENPRALYFNDAVSVGWTPSAPAIELMAVDPERGAIFYTLKTHSDGTLRLRREESCLTCHINQGTLHVPGTALRSMLTDPQGKPQSGYSPVDHATAFSRRWGGWYVTGNAGGWQHLGNLATSRSLAEFEQTDRRVPSVDLSALPPASVHLRSSSDLLPLLIHDHQVRLQTLATRLRYEALLDRPLETLEPLARALLFAGEPDWPAPVAGLPAYRRWFEGQGRRDRHGRSLRDLDLQTRLSQYGGSWLIDSDQIARLPQPARHRLFRRIVELVRADPPQPGLRQFSRTEQAEVLELLADTVEDFALFTAEITLSN